MSKRQAVRGMNDILPLEMPYWHFIESTFKRIVESYGYQEIRTPVLEFSGLFSDAIGAVTDIVEKEMYTFTDKGGETVSMRPEGTAGCVRAGIQHGLIGRELQRWWYHGPMFRYERPQKGRYRQFYQFGAEVFGDSHPDVDAELILLSLRFWKALGIEHDVCLQINSLGCLEARNRYRSQLVDYLKNHTLDEDSQRRLNLNPLRILDSKNPDMQPIIEKAPKLLDVLDEESKQHFEQFTQLLDHAGVKYEINPRLVRGLDYYGRTVFEWVTDKMGAQGTVCAGGRYDGLVSAHGGKACPAVGFAIGQERLVMLVQQLMENPPKLNPHGYLIMVGEAANQQGLVLAERLRDTIDGLRLVLNVGGGSFKSQFKRADKSGAGVALVLGEQEVLDNKIAYKALRDDSPQTAEDFESVCEKLQNSL